MTETEAAKKLEFLSSSVRLGAFGLMVEAGSEGVRAGALSKALHVAPSALSPHLAILVQSGFATVRSEGRYRRYVAEVGAMTRLLTFLMTNVCGGEQEAVTSAMAALGFERMEGPTDPEHAPIKASGS